MNKYLTTLISTIFLTSCMADAPEIPESEIYNREFIKTFGMPASSTWNSAERITANISPSLLREATDVRLYTGMPGSEGCQLVAHYPASTSSFMFDLPGGEPKVFVEISDASSNLYNVYGYYPVRDGRLEVGPRGSRAFASDGRVELSSLDKVFIDKSEYQGYDVNNMKVDRWGCKACADWWHALGYDDGVKICHLASMYHIRSGNELNGIDLGTRREYGNRLTINDMMPLVGPGGVLVEQECNLSLHSDRLNPTQGGEFVVTQDNAEINMEYFYGCGTAMDRCFGYMYYTPVSESELDSPENWKRIVSANRYILIWNTNPTRNIFDCDFPNGGMALGDAVNSKNLSKSFTSSIRDLVYFGEDGNSAPSYKFPKGTHIIFFIGVRSDSRYNEYIPYYSVPALNEKYGRGTVPSGHFKCSHADMPGTVFATYKWNGRTVIGVDDSNYHTQEDNYLGNDHDLNDILFYLNGSVENVRNKDEEMNEKAPQRQSWIIAAEDLGGTHDFDFNDVVFGISHVGGETTATVKALASGGTLPVFLHSVYRQTDGRNDGTLLRPAYGESGEFHTWFGHNNHYTDIINAHTYADTGAEVTLEVPHDFTLTDFNTPGEIGDNGLGGFWITVHDADGERIINTPVPDGSIAPQMFIAPSSWCWPSELTGIHTVYPNFIQWGDRWWEKTVSDNYIRHTWISE